MAPSPKKATATAPGRRYCADSANPAAVGPDAPTIPEEADKCSLENRCICPPFPPHSPSGRPSSSRRIRTGSTPRIIKGRGAAMIQSHGVAFPEVGDDAGDDGFFARPEMHLARDQSVVPELGDGFLKQAAFQHQGV